MDQQIAPTRKAKSDEECIACISALQAEPDAANENSIALREGRIYQRKQQDCWLRYPCRPHRGIQDFRYRRCPMTPPGILARAILVMNGVNGLSKEMIPRRYGEENKTGGIFADGATELAKFMGFTPQAGLAFYNVMTLSASVYSMFGLATKPGAWCLFKWLPRDYFRKVDTMSRPKLTMKIVGYGVKAKVIFDFLNMETISD
ncbi:DUF4225 domain-containing protein [Erwinia psidii]|uniref:DUF4225 domain-containing protein n=1 Tax=Erwinia psidii TaxID=69224 RepID=UPI00397C3934